MNIRLLNDNVIVRPIPREKIGLIELPESLKDDNNTGGVKLYWVMLAGPGRKNRNGIRIPLEVEFGDRIWVHSYTKGIIYAGLPHGDVIITADQILMVLPVHPGPHCDCVQGRARRTTAVCLSENEEGWRCCRIEGHKGEHRVCAIGVHDVLRWPNDRTEL